MARGFAKNSVRSSKMLFKKRSFILPLKENYNTVDINTNQSYFRSPEFLPLIPKEEKLIQVNKDFKILEITKNQYNLLSDFLIRKSITQKLRLGTLDLTKPPECRNYDLQQYYEQKIETYYTSFINYLNQFKIKIINFNQFYDVFTDYVFKVIKQSPFTFYSSYDILPSYYLNTGLAINIKNKNLDNDNDIYSDFLSNTNKFEGYVKAVNLFGFDVDKEVPYRLFLNLNRIRDIELKNFYKNNFKDYYELEISFIQNLFNDFYSRIINNVNNYNCFPCQTSQETIRTKFVQVPSVINMNSKKLLSFYVNCLYAEKQLPLPEEKDNIINNAIMLAEKVDLRSAMVYIIGQVNRLTNTKII